jgi:hypothetical protein
MSKWSAIWAGLERIFAELPLVIRHKSKRQDARAETSLQEASAALAEATVALQTALLNIRSQTEHHEAVHLSRFLGFVTPVLAELQGCFRPSKVPNMPFHLARSIEQEIEQLNDLGVRRYLRGILQEHTVGDALSVLADDQNAVGQLVIGMSFLLEDPGFADLLRGYVASLGTLSATCEEVEIGPGVAIGIGDIPSASARILFAQRYIATKGGW